MNWRKIDKAKRNQPKVGEYGDWKQQISNDCYNRCVYCSIHESPWGGIDHYHTDHFKPQKKFPKLKNTITNLYNSCPICNRFKSDDYPNPPNDLDKICYPDPSDYDYNYLFIIDTRNYKLIGKYVSSRYLINRLYLNRPQLIYERREFFLKEKAAAQIKEANSYIQQLEQIDDLKLLKMASEVMTIMHLHLFKRDKIPPYKLVEIRKKKKSGK